MIRRRSARGPATPMMRDLEKMAGSPQDLLIVGGGIFAHASLLPVSLAWESFEIGNGATSLIEMRRRVEKYRRHPAQPHEDYQIGCIRLEQPFFLPESQWIPAPRDWRLNIVQGKGYELTTEVGRELWGHIQHALAGREKLSPLASVAELGDRYGEPIVVRPRLGQKSFRIVVTDVYERRCAVTRERTLPALEAAHIRPYSEGGEHRIDNGLLLRRDLHALFDRGYVTVTPEMRLAVSRKIREDFENGRDYYRMQGWEVWRPDGPGMKPSDELLRWHNEQRYLG